MTEDEKLDATLRQMLRRSELPVDPEAKRRSLRVARELFEQQYSTAESGTNESSQGNRSQDELRASKVSPEGQGFWQRLRLIFGINPNQETQNMNTLPYFRYGSLATVGVSVLAVALLLQQNRYLKDTQPAQKIVQSGIEEVVVTASRQGPAEVKEELASDRPLVAKRRADAQPSAPEFASPAPAVQPSADRALAIAQGQPFNGKDKADGIAARAFRDSIPEAEINATGRDRFPVYEPNSVRLVSEDPISTFSADVDTASYSFTRRRLNNGVLPPADAVRVEELINYFDYDYPLPRNKDQPFAPSIALVDSPWSDDRLLLRIGIQGYDIATESKPRSNLVFLLDVSGSMRSQDKLPLVQRSMEMLLTTLEPDDTVAIVVYAGAAGAVLEPTPVGERQKILTALRRLSAGGSTAGGQGLRLAYELAESQFDPDAVNRVILATDGDFNVGITDQRELKSFIERKRSAGIFLSVLGFGEGNYQDALMQTLAQNGNGVAAYIDTLSEAQKVLVEESRSSLFPIAQDVKFQVEFNPSQVREYRLIGYETRQLEREDFNNDAVDSGDIGAGHRVTVLYELTPSDSSNPQIEQRRYERSVSETPSSDEIAFLKIRYKAPGSKQSQLIERAISDSDRASLAGDTAFAVAVAAFGQLVTGGRYTGDFSFDDVIDLAQRSKGSDPYGYRTEFIQLVRTAKTAAAMSITN
ncbi:MAG: VWA domain-containing protein [Pseudomonadota bacterium]